MSFNLSSVHLDTTIIDPTLGLTIFEAEVSQGDSFTPRIPTDRLRSVNWCTEGNVSVYARDMTFINTYGVGERMLVPNPDHLSFGKCVLICASNTAKYYCLCGNEDVYYNGEVIQLTANEEKTISNCNGHYMFCSMGTTNSLEKNKILIIDSDSYTVTAGTEGAIITVFYDSTDD